MIRIEVARTNTHGQRTESVAFSLPDTGFSIGHISQQIRTALSGSPDRYDCANMRPVPGVLPMVDDNLARQRIDMDDEDIERSLCAMQMEDVDEV